MKSRTTRKINLAPARQVVDSEEAQILIGHDQGLHEDGIEKAKAGQG